MRTEIVTLALGERFTPVMSSIAVDEDGGLAQLQRRHGRRRLAGALGAESLVLLSDVDQLRRDPDDPSTRRWRTVSASQLTSNWLESGAARDGMRPKVPAALDALDGGATRYCSRTVHGPTRLRDAMAARTPRRR